MDYKKITSVDMLKEISMDNSIECFIELNGGFRSNKEISYNSNEKLFYIINNIDDSEQELNEEQLFTESNIGEAITKGSFWQYMNDEY